MIKFIFLDTADPRMGTHEAYEMLAPRRWRSHFRPDPATA
jgi:hypothetical protein